MPYLTMTENLIKRQLRLGLVVSYDIQPGNGVGLFWDTKHTHIFTYLLTFPGPTRGCTLMDYYYYYYYYYYSSLLGEPFNK